MFIVKLFFCFIFFIELGWSQQKPRFTREAYLELKEHAEQLIEFANQNNARLLFIGRSPVLLAAYLESTGFNNYTFLPLSRIKYFNSEGDKLKAKENFLNHNWSQLFNQNVNLPLHRFALVDYVDRGSSLNQLLDWIPDGDIQNIGWVRTFGQSSLDLSTSNQVKFPGLDIGRLSSSELFGQEMTGSYLWLIRYGAIESYAPYKEWDPLIETSPPKISLGIAVYEGYISFNGLVQYFKEIKPDDLPSVDSCNIFALDPRFT